MIEGTTLQFVHRTEVDDIPTAICPYQGRVLISVGRLLRIYDLGKKKMLRKCEDKIAPHHISIQALGQRVYVSDVQESVFYIHYKRQENQLTVRLRHEPALGDRHLSAQLRHGGRRRQVRQCLRGEGCDRRGKAVCEDSRGSAGAGWRRREGRREGQEAQEGGGAQGGSGRHREGHDRRTQGQGSLQWLAKEQLGYGGLQRFYSNNDEDQLIPYFWEKFDKENYSIWFGEYKYAEELGQIFMSSNLVYDQVAFVKNGSAGLLWEVFSLIQT